MEAILQHNKPIGPGSMTTTLSAGLTVLFTILKRKAHAFSHWYESVGFGFEKYLIKGGLIVLQKSSAKYGEDIDKHGTRKLDSIR